MKKLIVTEHSARLMGWKEGQVVQMKGVECIITTMPDFDPYKDEILSDDSVLEIKKSMMRCPPRPMPI